MIRRFLKLLLSKYMLAVGAVSIVFLAYLLGWFSAQQEWSETSAWNQVSAEFNKTLYAPTATQPRMYWLGHAGIVIEWQGKRIAFDPNLSDSTKIIRRQSIVPLAASEFPPLEAVIVSHAHYDHLDMETIEHFPSVGSVVVPKGSEAFLSENVKRKAKVVGLDVSESLSIGPFVIRATKAVHNGSRYHAFSSAYRASGYIVSIKGSEEVLYFAGDTGWGSLFEEIKTRYSPTIAFLPIGGYTPYFVLRNYHLDPKDAVMAAKTLGVKLVIPIHFGTLRVALERVETPLPLFAEIANAKGLEWTLAPPMPALSK